MSVIVSVSCAAFFLQRLGVGMHTFSRIVRVNRAVGMMQTVGTGMASIANEVGFFDQPHFIHDFKALCGVSPSAYLKKCPFSTMMRIKYEVS